MAVMTYGFTRVGAIVKMKVKDYQIQGRKAFLVLHEKGGTLEVAARLAGHASTKTTQLYDRTSNKVDLGEVEKIRI